MQKHNTKKQEQEIMVLVKKYKMMICNQIKEGTNTKEGMLFEFSQTNP